MSSDHRSDTAGHIVAIGGGVRLRDGGDPIDEFLVSLCSTTSPRAAFIPTASGDIPGYAEMFHERYQSLGCITTDIPLLRRTPDLQPLLEQDLIYVGGGNTKSMLALWREWGVIDLLAQAHKRGAVLAGVSAGAICWFEQGVTDSWADSLRVMDCLGYITGSCCPHYDGEVERRPAYLAQVGSGEAQAGWAICDGAAVHFTHGQAVEVVSWIDGAQVFRVEAEMGRAVEVPQPIRPL